MLRKNPDMPPPPPLSAAARLRGRLRFDWRRLALSVDGMRRGDKSGLTIRRDGDLVQVQDGERHLFIADVKSAGDLRRGIGARLDATAAKYIGDTGYVPRDGDVIVDIGAGIGLFTLWCAEAGARVLAFEPDPLAYACLERNTGAQPGVRRLPYALWKERANLRLHGSPDTTESSLIEDGAPNVRLSDVEAWPLDQMPAIVGLPVIDFLKVDGEGVEPEILSGGLRTLRRTRVIAVDVGASARRPNLRARVETILDSLHFRPLSIDNGDTILALNTAMVGPFSNRVGGLRRS